MLKVLMSLIVAALLALAGPALAADKDGKAPAKSAAAQKSVPDSEKLDLNMASEDDLIKLPGIGAARAKAIIKNRPYKAKDELVGRKVITASVYEKIKEQVIARQAK
jgi:DNA uptake protein ComE-like DNA-binding protein